ncbi:MAG: carotenoid 1,2-hydratase [Deltaproteobacteria bacterium]|nr:carotenoid 1,2-hydratase [Deltaproteobacteria bacterium]
MLARLWALACGSLLACSTTPSVDGGASDAARDAGPTDAAASLLDGSALDSSGPGLDAEPEDAAAEDTGAPADATCSPTGRVTLPADDSVHASAPIEWWYWTGHLQTDDGKWLGFEEVFFRVVQFGFSVQFAHHALTDVSAGTFHYAEERAFSAPRAVPNGFELVLGPISASGGDGHDVLHAEVDGKKLDLTLEATDAPVLQHGDGYTDYAFGGNTYYYSRERMTAEGTLTTTTASVRVRGSAWFDHQWGEIQTAITAGWDWFALQLDDGREVMIFVVRVDGEDVLVGGSVSTEECGQLDIGPDDFSLTPTGTWASSDGCTYPAGWDLTVNGETFVITPVLADQELKTLLQRYWEGAAEVSGASTGRAYVELTGYCR